MQSSQSSATIAFRAIVMLAFIIAVPLIAFNNGSSLPEKARKLLDQIRPMISSAVSKTNASVLPDAPAYDAKSQNLLSVPSTTLGGMSKMPQQLTADNQPNLLPVQPSDVGAQRLNPPASSVIPVNYQSAVDSSHNSPAVNYSGQADANPFMALQDRLRQLGATYYLLETWGNQRQFFRFYCQMAVGGSANYTRYFEATNANPLEAMADVLRQVEAWRSGSETVR
jgi:hypothetical protein